MWKALRLPSGGAETGHLVLTTFHSTTATSAIERLIDFAPPHRQSQMRVQLPAAHPQSASPSPSRHGPGPGNCKPHELTTGPRHDPGGQDSSYQEYFSVIHCGFYLPGCEPCPAGAQGADLAAGCPRICKYQNFMDNLLKTVPHSLSGRP